MTTMQTKRAVRVVFFSPFFMVAFAGMALMAPLFVVIDWTLAKEPYHPRQTIGLLLAVMGETIRGVWTGEM